MLAAPAATATPTVEVAMNDENAGSIEIKAASATGKGTHTRFCDDSEQADSVLADISNKDAAAKAAAEQVAAEEVAATAAQEEEAETEKVPPHPAAITARWSWLATVGCWHWLRGNLFKPDLDFIRTPGGGGG